MPKVIIEIRGNKKKCSRCHKWKNLLSFRVQKLSQTGVRSQCRKCELIYINKYRKEHERIKIKTLNSNYKIMVLNHYGKKCFCCKENNPSLLTVDHINDDGKKHGTINCRYKGIGLYRFLIKNNYPKGLQTACFNCNIGRRINGGDCPHKTKY